MSLLADREHNYHTDKTKQDLKWTRNNYRCKSGQLNWGFNIFFKNTISSKTKA